jgi:hypothetical protein
MNEILLVILVIILIIILIILLKHNKNREYFAGTSYAELRVPKYKNRMTFERRLPYMVGHRYSYNDAESHIADNIYTKQTYISDLPLELKNLYTL